MRNKFIMLCGLPASGKSTTAKDLSVKENAVIYSSDELRKELFGNVEECNKNHELFKELHQRIKEGLKDGKNVIYDATNISHKRRRGFLSELKKYNCEKICYLVATPYEKCLTYNSMRERKVPEHVLQKMYLSFYIPQYNEGWDDIEILYNTAGFNFDTNDLFNGKNGLNTIDQDNPNHTLTIGNHCLKCSSICKENTDDFELNLAALYHDIGKRFTKQFKNKKGDETDIAHYYQHHLVSAYDAMFYLKGLNKESILNIVNYIQWHMQPYFINTEKSLKRFLRWVGEDFYQKLLILHEADKKSK